ncbi:UNVERIFIED_CONTAM: hypothetical protein HDU68_009434 [Siphonaria sp. JEL0065]|nr:hypothetical protein HDU68_009434 [Siphonaria sp. JEL0065]
MLTFLKNAAKAFAMPGSSNVIVSGNEACDLDSLVSAVSLARLLTLKHNSSCFVPLVAVPRIEFGLRTDCMAALKEAYPVNHVLIEQALVFLDSSSSFSNLPTRLILTDHNIPSLSLKQRFNNSFSVVGIVDHHKDELLHTSCEFMRIINPVGSATSLVTNLYSEYSLAHHIDAPFAKLLLSPILLDTVNLDPASGRVTRQDSDAYDFLMSVILKEDPSFTSNSLFESLQKAKFDTSHLTCMELLRRDYKQTSCGKGVVGRKLELGISSVGSCFEDLVLREGGSVDRVDAVTQEFLAEKGLDIFMVMTAFEVDGAFNRELVVFVKDGSGHERLFVDLEAHSDLKLVRNPLSYESKGREIRWYSVQNLKMSRKVVQPILLPMIEHLLCNI